ncbi:hypothetical protein FRX31_017814, partial [Thalictrum thalictroides]
KVSIGLPKDCDQKIEVYLNPLLQAALASELLVINPNTGNSGNTIEGNIEEGLCDLVILSDREDIQDSQLVLARLSKTMGVPFVYMPNDLVAQSCNADASTFRACAIVTDWSYSLPDIETVLELVKKCSKKCSKKLRVS